LCQTQLFVLFLSDSFGHSCAISGDGGSIIIGASFGTNRQFPASRDLATIFYGLDYNMQQNLAQVLSDSDVGFGRSVSLDQCGETAIIGAPLIDDPNTDAGGAYIFTKCGSTLWNQKAKLTIPSASMGHEYGGSADISDDGNVAIIGAPFANGSGRAAIFERVIASDTWIFRKVIQASDETGSQDEFGFSVALNCDGSIAVVGAHDNNVFDVDDGSAHVFNKVNASDWQEVQRLLASDIADSQHFGSGVDISSDGQTIVIGSAGRDDVNISGAAYVFTLDPSDSIWKEEQKLVQSLSTDTDQMGISVSIDKDGNTIIVGANDGNIDLTSSAFADLTDGSGEGSATIWRKSGGVWTEIERITASDTTTGNRFGTCVSVNHDGDIFVVGDPHEGGQTSGNTGAAYIFFDTQNEEQTLLTSSDFAGFDFAGDCAISGDNSSIIVGAFGAIGTNFNTNNTVTIYDGLSYNNQHIIIGSDTTITDGFGFSVSLDKCGKTAIIGTPFGDEPKENAGNAYIFTKSDSTWSEHTKLILPTDSVSPNDQYGRSAAISNDGNVVIFGAPFADTGGAAAIFERDTAMDVWNFKEIITPSDETNGKDFGTSVSLDCDGGVAVIGAPGDNSDEGAAYIFNKVNASDWQQIQKIVALDSTSNSIFGTSVDISGDSKTLVVGAPRSDTSPGATYVFTESSGTWTQEQKLIQSLSASDDRMGIGVSIDDDGDTIIVGAESLGTGVGSVTIWKKINSIWIEHDRILPSDSASGSRFGQCVSSNCDGDTFVIGDPNRAGDETGAAYVLCKEFDDTELILNEIGCSTLGPTITLGATDATITGGPRIVIINCVATSARVILASDLSTSLTIDIGETATDTIFATVNSSNITYITGVTSTTTTEVVIGTSTAPSTGDILHLTMQYNT